MDRTVSVKTPLSAERKLRLTGTPDSCPRCHAHMVPRDLGAAARSETETQAIENCFQCTNAKCGGTFIASYALQTRSAPNVLAKYRLTSTFPVEPLPPPVPELVATLSPTFLETFAQSISAESHQLTQLTGIGLRKALEFLVKDFAITEHPDAAEAIRSKPLAACIKDYIADHGVRELAKRAAWLGNDETHYLRRWEDRDVTDLKVLIRLTINGIENILLARKYVEEMPE
jgi:hypothetical protein